MSGHENQSALAARPFRRPLRSNTREGLCRPLPKELCLLRLVRNECPGRDALER